jgi:CheY-like chemotaxis protein
VTDNGIGIPGEMLARIFDLFAQVDSGSDRSQGGLGIGLSLVRRLVEMHGGAIAVHSAGRNQGSEFTVMLPVAESVVSDRSERSEELPAAAGRRILLIEDNADGRRSLALLLKLAGHDVVAAENGRRGIAAAAGADFDVALIDIGLPDTDGYEVATQLRGAHGNSIFLVALTGFSQPEDKQRALAAGFEAHLTKPVELATLQKLLASKTPH